MGVALVGLIPFAWWAIRTINGISKDLRQVSQSLYGVDGTNGFRGELQEVEDRVRDHDGRLNSQAIVLDRHTGRLDTHDRELAALNRTRP